MSNNDIIDFYGEIKWETDDAYLIFDGENDVWLPKSQIKNRRMLSDGDCEIAIPEWLAKEKGII